MGAPLDLSFCVKCGFLFIRTVGRAKRGWTHHDGTRNARLQPNWCTCRAREPVPRHLHAAILGADQVGGREAAQSLLDQVRGNKPGRHPARLQVSRKNYQPVADAYNGIDRSVAPSGGAFAHLYGHKGSMLIVDDPPADTTEKPTDEQRQKILDWFTRVLPRTGSV